VDEIVPEPEGGAHQDTERMAETLRTVLIKQLKDLRSVKPEKLVRRRAEKFAAMGVVTEA
ncbi:MAG TPA: acetyl-CoA carboxylase carboxyl transferase subunit alpha, partial [Gemmatimonadales bacterium]|nr:acetyl-CoA carboxylase carboxyl transferase subunit alpha [Gemmatimonadales bacterium]